VNVFERIIVADVDEERALTGGALERAMKKHGRQSRQERMLRRRTERLAYAIGAVAAAALLLHEQADYSRGVQERQLRQIAGTLETLFDSMRAELAPLIADDEEIDTPRGEIEPLIADDGGIEPPYTIVAEEAS